MRSREKCNSIAQNVNNNNEAITQGRKSTHINTDTIISRAFKLEIILKTGLFLKFFFSLIVLAIRCLR